MAKNRKNDIDSFSGMFNGTDEPIKGQETIETLEGGKYMPEPPKTEEKATQTATKPKEKKTSTEPKKVGRPPLKNREKKGRYSFTIMPSLYEQAQSVAYENGKTLSELITEFLTEYVRKNS